jgi:hypothetical protein
MKLDHLIDDVFLPCDALLFICDPPPKGRASSSKPTPQIPRVAPNRLVRKLNRLRVWSLAGRLCMKPPTQGDVKLTSSARAPTLRSTSHRANQPFVRPPVQSVHVPVMCAHVCSFRVGSPNGHRVSGCICLRSGRPPLCGAPRSPVVTSSPTLFRCRPDNLHTIMHSSAFRTKSPSRLVILCTVREYVSHTTSSRVLDIGSAPQCFGPPSHHVWISCKCLATLLVPVLGSIHVGTPLFCCHSDQPAQSPYGLTALSSQR